MNFYKPEGWKPQFGVMDAPKCFYIADLQTNNTYWFRTVKLANEFCEEQGISKFSPHNYRNGKPIQNRWLKDYS
jgi:hypothetical protein